MSGFDTARLSRLGLLALVVLSIGGSASGEPASAATWANPEAGAPLKKSPRFGGHSTPIGRPGRWYRVLDVSSGANGGAKDWIKVAIAGRSGWMRRTYLDLRFGRRPATCRNSNRAVSGWRPMPSVSTTYFLWNALRGGRTRSAARAWGTCSSVENVRQVLREFHDRHPERARVGIGDISLRRGGYFSGHGSHRNGVDIDLYYPRADNREVSTQTARQMNRRLSQELINLFVRSGSRLIYVGPSTGMRGRGVQVYPGHDNHFHVHY